MYLNLLFYKTFILHNFSFIYFLRKEQKIMEEEQKRFIERGSHKGKGLAVFTSGGDSQGTGYF